MKITQPTTKDCDILRKERGTTLVEILIVLIIVAGMGGGAAMLVGLLGAGALKSEAMKITSAIKYTYSQAAVNNSRYRIVFDLDANTYHAEVIESAITEERNTLDDSANDEFLTQEAKDLASAERKKESLFDKDEKNPFGVNRRISYTRVQNGVIKPGTLKSGVRLKRVVVGEHHQVEDGKASVSFFPNGFQEAAIIYLEDGHGAIFSIRTEPLTGRVKLYSKEIDVPEDFGTGEDDD